MYRILFLLFFFTNIIFAQKKANLEDDLVKGIISNKDGVYLVLDYGYVQIEKSDKYQEYYRKIYKDSTIVNPNTEIKGNFDLSIIPLFSIRNQKGKRIDFEEPYNLNMFINKGEADEFTLTKSAEDIIDLVKKKRK